MPTNMADVVKMAAAKAAVFSFSKVVYEDMVYVYLCVYINRYIYIYIYIIMKLKINMKTT